MKCSSNHPEFTHIQSDQSLIFILYFLFTSSFSNNLNFFHLSNGESTSIRTIRLEVPIAMTLKPFLPSDFFGGSLAIPLPLSRILMAVDGDSFVWVEVALGGTRRTNRGRDLKGFSTLKLLLNLDN